MDETIEIGEEIRVAMGIVVKSSEILLVKRSHREADLLWQFPGGKIKTLESPENAAVREVYEETGVRCTARKMIGFRKPHPSTGASVYYVVCDYVSGHTIIKDTSEIERVKWVRTRDLSAYMPHKLFPGVLKYLTT
ncbi:MAG: NUDIX hydrolase [Bacteroidota bacterium]